MQKMIDEFELALLSLDKLAASQVLASSKLAPIEFVEKVIVPTLEHVGREWEQGTLALSQIYMCGRICEDLVNSILADDAAERKRQPRLALAALEDYHLLGKRIVYSVLRASGFMVADYGRMEVEELVQRVRDDQIQVLLISTLMLPSALRVRALRDRLSQENLPVKIVVGGAPFRFDDQLWQTVGADAMGRQASEVIGILGQWLGGGA